MPSPPDPPPAPRPTQTTALPPTVERGVCLAHTWQDGGRRGYGTDTCEKTLTHLAHLGVQSVSLTPFGWMSSLHTPDIHGEFSDAMPSSGERAGRLRRVTAQAHALGMRVVLKPHLWVRGGKWRGEIAPVDAHGEPAWGQWWEKYRDFITYYARLAQKLGIGELVVGVELVSAVKADPDAFAATIAAVRKVFDGKLTYGANWDEEVPERIWRKLDAVGVQFYPPLTDQPHPTVAQLRKALRARLEHWTAIAHRTGRPLEIVETGYRSAPTAVQKPFGWPEHSDKHPVDQALQAQAYRALFDELATHKDVAAVYLWKYFTDPNTGENRPDGFSPRGKPAEAVLRAAFAPAATAGAQ